MQDSHDGLGGYAIDWEIEVDLDGIPVIACPVCGHDYPAAASVARHRERPEDKIMVYGCLDCGKHVRRAAQWVTMTEVDMLWPEITHGEEARRA